MPVKLTSNKITNFKSKMKVLCDTVEHKKCFYIAHYLYICNITHTVKHIFKKSAIKSPVILYIQYEILIKIFTFKAKPSTSNRSQFQVYLDTGNEWHLKEKFFINRALHEYNINSLHKLLMAPNIICPFKEPFVHIEMHLYCDTLNNYKLNIKLIKKNPH